MAKINHFISCIAIAHYNGCGTAYPVKANNGAYYLIYIEASTNDVVYRKSTNGTTWGDAIVIKAETGINLAVWYDRWTPGLSTDLIHIAYTGTTADDTFYRTINTASADALSTETTIFAGATAVAGDGAISITRATGGNVYCKTMIDAGAEGGFFRLPNANVPNGAWDAARTDTEALAQDDTWILVPGFNGGDTNDIMCIFWDASADEISRYVYDDSGNSWAETSISTGMVEPTNNVNYPHFAAAVDHTNSQILVVAWNGVDTANQDLLGWKVTESAITAFATTPVLNATDDCGCCGIAIDTDTQDWYVYYAGKSDGTEVWTTSVSLNYKVSTDDGATWGSETDAVISGTAAGGDVVTTSGGVPALWVCPRFNTRQIMSWVLGSATLALMATVDEPAAAAGSGGAHILGGTVVR